MILRRVGAILLALAILTVLVMLLTAAFNWALMSQARAETGVASWYSYSGHRTANGERYTGRDMTCATRYHRFGEMLRVTDLATGRSIVCRANDRGPFVRGRIIDLSRAAALRLGILSRGTARVSVVRVR